MPEASRPKPGEATKPAFTGAWAKLTAEHTLPLADHGEDVAAVMRALLERSAYRRALEAAAGVPLSPQAIERLLALAFLHDMGKTNFGFWRRQFDGAPPVGHTEVVGALLQDQALCGRSEPAPLVEALLEWRAIDLFRAAMAHHGRPLQSLLDPEGEGSHPSQGLLPVLRKQWKDADGYSPMAELGRLLAAARVRFPLAFAGGPILPDKPRFVALFAGLMTLADWLGSDARRFPVAGPHGSNRLGFSSAAAREAVDDRGLAIGDSLWRSSAAAFEQAFGFTPHQSQREAAALGLGRVSVLEAETGSGKTEAALWRFLRLAAAGEVDGLYFALPTRTAATQIHGRVDAALKRVFGDQAPAAVLAVPGYLRAGDDEGRKLPGFEVLWPDRDDDGPISDGRWAAEAPKRYLAARVAVGTVDQALLAGLKVRHAHLRAAVLARCLLVVDEVHASDVYMTAVLKAVIRNHVEVGGHAMLLSATLGSAARANLLEQNEPTLAEALRAPYPALSGSETVVKRVATDGRSKAVGVGLAPFIDDPSAVARMALGAARAGALVLVVRNRVDEAIAVAKALEEQAGGVELDLLFRVNNRPTLHHGRFAPPDRRLLDAEVEVLFGKTGGARRPVVLVGTQTLEQSLDIDADLLLTDLAPIDVLLQRFGRLHRHERARPAGFERPRAVVLVPAARDLSPLRVSPRQGLGPLKDGRGVYPNLTAVEATWSLLEAHPTVTIPDDNRRLVELATHPEALDAVAARQGWLDHKLQQDGFCIADRGLARHHRLDMGEPFARLLFPNEEAIRTRLGADDRLVDLPEPLPGPFGATIERLRLPGWMARGVTAEPEVVARRDDETIYLLVDDLAFRYDRFGLHRERNC